MTTHDRATQVDAAADDSGCTVDWSWLVGREIASVTSDLQHFRVTCKDGQTLAIQAATYQGKAFLAFDPWKAPGS